MMQRLLSQLLLILCLSCLVGCDKQGKTVGIRESEILERKTTRVRQSTARAETPQSSETLRTMLNEAIKIDSPDARAKEIANVA
jgi:hypothetical protein